MARKPKVQAMLIGLRIDATKKYPYGVAAWRAANDVVNSWATGGTTSVLRFR